MTPVAGKRFATFWVFTKSISSRNCAEIHGVIWMHTYGWLLCRPACDHSGESHGSLALMLLKGIPIHLPFLSWYFCKSMPSWMEVLYQAVPNHPPNSLVFKPPLSGHKFRHRVNGVGRGGGQTVFNQILTRFHGIRSKSGPNPLKSCIFRGTRRTPTGLKKYNG